MKKNPAFTLIELMVSITILLLLTGTAMITMNGFNDRQKTQGVRSEIRSMIELARNYALTMQYPTDSELKPDYYKLEISAENKVTIEVHFSNDTTSKFVDAKDYSNQGVTITGNKIICFEPFEAVQYDCGGVGTENKTINFETDDVTYSLTVNSNGQISETP